MKIRSFVASDIGWKRKKHEDCFLVDEELGVYIIWIGMGWHVASFTYDR